MRQATLNFDRLLKLRLIVARTHYFAQARSVFAVAAHRSREVFDLPDSVTLWWLPEIIEEEFEAKWEHWLDHADEWHPFFRRLENFQENDLKIALHAFDAVTNCELEMSSRLRRSVEGRAVPLPEPFSGTDQDIALLAIGFARGGTPLRPAGGGQRPLPSSG